MFFHRGGYGSGSILSHRRMVIKTGWAGGVLTLGYRLAPEHPFCAALRDALTRFVRAWCCRTAHCPRG
jgi:monoterpene epsilon-lactone hydrolase